jgi:triphosphoribosyl-dephospho-CoA synthase
MILSPAPSPSVEEAARRVGRLAHRALLREALLTPKPGLVDRDNSGAHPDMNVMTFVASARAIAPWMAEFFLAGVCGEDLPPRAALARLRPLGVACERAMLAATGGANTHKGAIFAFGLALGAAGRLFARGEALDCAAVCAEVAAMCQNLVAHEMAGPRAEDSAGVRAFRAYGFAGARGEAARGYPLVRLVALPAYERALAEGAGRDEALLIALLHLLERASDTNLLSRGGMEAVLYVRARATEFLRAGSGLDLKARLSELDRDFVARNLSPGGSADLLSLMWFFHRLPVALPQRSVLAAYDANLASG